MLKSLPLLSLFTRVVRFLLKVQAKGVADARRMSHAIVFAAGKLIKDAENTALVVKLQADADAKRTIKEAAQRAEEIRDNAELHAAELEADAQRIYDKCLSHSSDMLAKLRELEIK